MRRGLKFLGIVDVIDVLHFHYRQNRLTPPPGGGLGGGLQMSDLGKSAVQKYSMSKTSMLNLKFDFVSTIMSWMPQMLRMYRMIRD